MDRPMNTLKGESHEMAGKVALVTGSTSGIGKAVAETLARHGVKVVVSGRDSVRGEEVVELIRQSGGEAVFISVDLQEPTAPQQLIKQTIECWGSLDIVVNNAAITCHKAVDRIEPEDWDRLFAVNLKAPFFIIQAALPFLKLSRGSVINISSMNGIINDLHNLVYDSLKAGLNHMTKGLALDFQSEGIRFNALLPGGTATPVLNAWYRQHTDDPVEADRMAEEAKSSPSVANPQQIADVVLFLAGNQSSWINGVLLPLDGGYSLGFPMA